MTRWVALLRGVNVGGGNTLPMAEFRSGRSKLTIEVFERAFDVAATARNLNTVRVLADLG